MLKKRKLLSLLVPLTVLSVAACTTDTSSENVNDSVESVDSTGGNDSSGDKPVADEPSDLNIYLYTDVDTFENRNWVWAWNGVDSFGFKVSSDSVVSVDGLPEDYLCIPVHIKWNEVYDVFVTDWRFTQSGTMSFTGIDDPNLFTGLIFRSQDGSKQSGDITIDWKQAKKDANGNYSVYVYENRGVFYDVKDFPTLPVNPPAYTELDNAGDPGDPGINITGSHLDQVLGDFSEKYTYLRPYRYKEDGTKAYGDNITFSSSSTIGTDKTAGRLRLDKPLDLSYKYEFYCTNPNTGALTNMGDLNMLSYYSSSAFGTRFNTDKTLGATIAATDDSTTFRLWSPSASAVTLNLYAPDAHASDSPVYKTVTMNRDDNGVWEATEQGNLGGYYYTYDVTNYGTTNKGVSDPYAQSSDANGAHSMVVDWNKVNKFADSASTTWAPDTKAAGTTIMEMQTRDFTSNESWTGTEANRGKFAGLTESGTETEKGTATGFDYVKGLKDNGLTHVQIMPSYDFQSVDETKLDDADYNSKPFNGSYNWGYDPQQYDVPEGSFSSDPNDGYARVNEMRNFVDTYNQNGIGVVMDVVYNHMPSQNGSSFEKVFPGYYFRSSSYSGAGSDIASQRSMVRKFIVDSVTGWAEHYHMSGFRFDLMGILDLETMGEVRAALDEIDPNILVYGEGWSMFSGDDNSGLDASTDMADQVNIGKLGDDWVGAFNDKYRDGMKGSVFDGDGIGYVQKNFDGYVTSDDNETNFLDDSTVASVYYGLTGTYYGSTTVSAPVYATANDGIGASLAYVECHDNMTLWDKLTVSSGKTVKRVDAGNSNNLTIDGYDMDLVEKEAEMTNANVLGSLSPAFFQIGQDFGRSKSWTDTKYNNDGKYVTVTDTTTNETRYYSTDSYNLSDDINGIDWNLLDTHSDLHSSFVTNLKARKDRSAALTADLTQANVADTNVFNLDLLQNKQVISYSVKLNDTQTAYFIQNFSDSAVTYDDQSIAAHTTLTYIK